MIVRVRALWTICAVCAATFLALSAKLHLREQSRPTAQSGGGGIFAPSERHARETGGDGRISSATNSLEEMETSELPTPIPANRSVLHTCSCLAGHREQEPRGRFRWLHIPKTGTSFIASLYAQACSDRLGRIDLGISPHYREGCGACFDFALIARYPPEMYCRRDSFDSFETQHRAVNDAEVRRALITPLGSNYSALLAPSPRRGPGAKNKEVAAVVAERIDLVGFFRDPKSRVVSAFDYAMHAAGMPSDEYTAMKVECKGNVTCYAARPAIMGCMAKMLAGRDCAQGVDMEQLIPNAKLGSLGLLPLPVASRKRIDSARRRSEGATVIEKALSALEAMAFVGITDDWNESVCQFYKKFGGAPGQDQFKNVRPGRKRSKVDDLPPDYRDEADEMVYAAALEKFRAAVGNEPCYEAVEVKEVQPSRSASEEGERKGKTAVACVAKSCSDLGMQCGKWPDGCGGSISCGICGSSVRDSLPEDWRHTCVAGQCVRTCPMWVDGGLWFQGEGRTRAQWLVDLGRRGAPLGGIGAGPHAQKKKRPVPAQQLELLSDRSDAAAYLAPSDAVRLCADACASETAVHKVFAANFCSCGVYPQDYLRNPPKLREYTLAHDIFPLEISGKKAGTPFNVRRGRANKLRIDSGASQPLCCPAASSESQHPSTGFVITSSLWRRGFVWADFFDSIDMGCGSHRECEEAGILGNATVVILDVAARMCHLGTDAGGVMSLPVERHYLRLEPTKRGIRDGPPLNR